MPDEFSLFKPKSTSVALVKPAEPRMLFGMTVEEWEEYAKKLTTAAHTIMFQASHKAFTRHGLMDDKVQVVLDSMVPKNMSEIEAGRKSRAAIRKALAEGTPVYTQDGQRITRVMEEVERAVHTETGEEALIRPQTKHTVKAQFTRLDHPHSHGWHDYPLEEFHIQQEGK